MTEGRLRVSELPQTERPTYKALNGVTHMSNAELLAALIGSENALDGAHAVLSTFGMDLRRATPRELTMLPGIGAVAAARIRAGVELGIRVGCRVEAEKPCAQSPADAYALVRQVMTDAENEMMVVLCLNTRNRLIGEPVILYSASLNQSLVRVGEVFREAVRRGAAAVIVCHNHPSGDPSPSPEDVAITRAMTEAGKLLDIDLLDHLVIGRNGYVSLKAKGLEFNF